MDVRYRQPRKLAAPNFAIHAKSTNDGEATSELRDSQGIPVFKPREWRIQNLTRQILQSHQRQSRYVADLSCFECTPTTLLSVPRAATDPWLALPDSIVHCAVKDNLLVVCGDESFYWGVRRHLLTNIGEATEQLRRLQILQILRVGWFVSTSNFPQSHIFDTLFSVV